MFLAPWNRSRSRSKKNQEPETEPLGKKKSGAGAAEKFDGSPALRSACYLFRNDGESFWRFLVPEIFRLTFLVKTAISCIL